MEWADRRLQVAFVRAAETALTDLLAADLSSLDLGAIMIDGVHFAEHCCVVALGIDTEGTKHPLAVAEGSTENTTVVGGLPTDLRERGLGVTHPILAVLDGSKALAVAASGEIRWPPLGTMPWPPTRAGDDRVGRPSQLIVVPRPTRRRCDSAKPARKRRQRADDPPVGAVRTCGPNTSAPPSKPDNSVATRRLQSLRAATAGCAPRPRCCTRRHRPRAWPLEQLVAEAGRVGGYRTLGGGGRHRARRPRAT